MYFRIFLQFSVDLLFYEAIVADGLPAILLKNYVARFKFKRVVHSGMEPGLGECRDDTRIEKSKICFFRGKRSGRLRFSYESVES